MIFAFRAAVFVLIYFLNILVSVTSRRSNIKLFQTAGPEEQKPGCCFLLYNVLHVLVCHALGQLWFSCEEGCTYRIDNPTLNSPPLIGFRAVMCLIHLLMPVIHKSFTCLLNFLLTFFLIYLLQQGR